MASEKPQTPRQEFGALEAAEAAQAFARAENYPPALRFLVTFGVGTFQSGRENRSLLGTLLNRDDSSEVGCLHHRMRRDNNRVRSHSHAAGTRTRRSHSLPDRPPVPDS